MKIKLLVILFASIIGLTSCEQPDNYKIDESVISGTWYVTRMTGGIKNVDYIYSRGEVTWVFDEDSNRLTIVNKVYDGQGFSSGTYSYSISNDDGILHIGNFKSIFDININGNAMIYGIGTKDSFEYLLVR